MSSIGINDLMYNSAAEYGPYGFWKIAGDALQLCVSGQRVWVRAMGRWFFWQLVSREEIEGGLKIGHWDLVGEVRVCFDRRPMRPSAEQE